MWWYWGWCSLVVQEFLADAICVEQNPPLSVAVAEMAWAFTQYEPLSTGEFISQAERRGFYLDTGRLRQLYRRGLLVPFVYASSRRDAGGRART